MVFNSKADVKCLYLGVMKPVKKGKVITCDVGISSTAALLVDTCKLLTKTSNVLDGRH